MYQPKYAISDLAPSGIDTSLIPAKTGVINRVISGWAIVAGAATTIVLNSKGTGAGTAITSTIPCAASGGGICWPVPAQQSTGEPPFGYFESARGEGITATTGAGSSIGISLVYIQITG